MENLTDLTSPVEAILRRCNRVKVSRVHMYVHNGAVCVHMYVHMYMHTCSIYTYISLHTHATFHLINQLITTALQDYVVRSFVSVMCTTAGDGVLLHS